VGADKPVKKFPSQLMPGAKARATDSTPVEWDVGKAKSMSTEARQVRIAYTVYRNILQQQNDPGCSDYLPGRSLSGDPKGLSIEDKVPSNAWEDLLDRYKSMQIPGGLSLDRYIRTLFWLLRGRGIAIPTPRQVLSAEYMALFFEFWRDKEKLISLDFTSQVRRLRTDIAANASGMDMSYTEAVYRTIVDKSKSYTALFRYAVARNTISSVSTIDLRVGDTKYIELIDKLARKYQILASLEYTLFPDLIERVWGGVLPENFRADAEDSLNSVISRFASQL
jgi:hypothetical protein